jgi:hypothetical protein
MKNKKGITSIITIFILISVSVGVGLGAYFISEKIKESSVQKDSVSEEEEAIEEAESFEIEVKPTKEPQSHFIIPEVSPSPKPSPQPEVDPALRESPIPALQANFNQSGVTLDWDVATESHTNNWRLLWDEPGSLALTVNLEFNQQSQCDLGQGYQVCDQSKLVNGEMAQMEGNRVGDKVMVIKLKKL